MIPTTVHPDPATAAPITFTREYPASPAELWALWTTAEGFASWWGPEGFRADVHEIDGREGGRLRYDMVAATPEMVAAMTANGGAPSHAVTSRFATFRPYTELSLASIIDFLPGVPAYTSTIVVRFEALGARTRMTVHLHPMHDADTSKMQAEGFGSQLTKLDRRYAGA